MKVYTGTTWVHADGGKCCELCRQPMVLLQLGKDRFPIWAHTGPQLETCKALRLSYNFAKTITRRMEDFKRRLRFEADGIRIRRFREEVTSSP